VRKLSVICEVKRPVADPGIDLTGALLCQRVGEAVSHLQSKETISTDEPRNADKRTSNAMMALNKALNQKYI